MKFSASKFRRRWAAAQCNRDPRTRIRKMARLAESFGCTPVVLTRGREPVAYKAPNREVFCVKKTYRSWDAAATVLARLNRLRGRSEQSIYACSICRGYHLTSRPGQAVNLETSRP